MNQDRAYDLLHPNLINIERLAGAASSFMPGRKRKQDEIERPSVAWQEMAREWLPVRDLKGETLGMRLAGERHLPKFKRETPDEYSKRLNTSFDSGILPDTIDEMVSKPFSKGITFEGVVPDWVWELNEDVDGIGTTIHEFAKNFLEDALWWGKSHVAVDAIGMPPEVPDDAQNRDFDGARPRMRMVPGPNAIGWKRSGDRERQIKQVRWYERVVDDQDVLEIINVWDETTLVEHARDEKTGAYKATSTIKHLMEEVPLVTLYTKRTGVFTARPPFMDVAWIAIDWWNSYSDQRQILHTARVPILFRKGFAKDEMGSVIGARRVHSTSSTEADMRYVEVTGSAMKEGSEHLKGLQDQAREKGSKPLYAKGPVTATGEYRADSKATCDLQAWCEALERALRGVYRLAQKAKPGLEELPDDFRPRVFSDFDLRDRSQAMMSTLDAARGRHDVSRVAWIAAAKSVSYLPSNFDEAADKLLIEKEIAEGIEHEGEMSKAVGGEEEGGAGQGDEAA